MNRVLHFKQTNESKVYFWGCTHFFHNPKWPVPLWKSRGYNSMEECTNSLRDKINQTCRKNDILFLVGDGFLNSTPEQVEDFLGTLNPKIYYWWGNHESSTSKIYKKAVQNHFNDLEYPYEVYPFTYKNITFVGTYAEVVVDGNYFIIQHFPLKVWNNSKSGAMHIHSHNHGGLVSSLPTSNEGRILDVGIEVFPDNPASLTNILSIMNKKDIKKFDSHN